MTPEEFVAKYDIRGGAESVRDNRLPHVYVRLYDLWFTVGNGGGGFRFTQHCRSEVDFAPSAPPFTSAAFIGLLADSVRTESKTVVSGAHGDMEMFAEVSGGGERLRKLMGDAMWSDFMTVTSAV